MFLYVFGHTQMHNPIFVTNFISTTNPMTMTRILINKYMSRAQPTPPIFTTPTFNAFDAPQKEYVNMAYKHPLVLQDELDGLEDDDVAGGDDVDAGQCNEFRSIELANNGNGDEDGHQHEQQLMDDCKLIGKPNPILVRTWEKLSRRLSLRDGAGAAAVAGADQSLDHDRISVDAKSSKIMGQRKSMNLTKRPNESDSSEHFYDSIDNEPGLNRMRGTLDDRVCGSYNVADNGNGDDDDDGDACMMMHHMMAGGEGLAEPPMSLINGAKANFCWSTDSEKVDDRP